jgi:hypothetical protein
VPASLRRQSKHEIPFAFWERRAAAKSHGLRGNPALPAAPQRTQALRADPFSENYHESSLSLLNVNRHGAARSLCIFLVGLNCPKRRRHVTVNLTSIACVTNASLGILHTAVGNRPSFTALRAVAEFGLTVQGIIAVAAAAVVQGLVHPWRRNAFRRSIQWIGGNCARPQPIVATVSQHQGGSRCERAGGNLKQKATSQWLPARALMTRSSAAPRLKRAHPRGRGGLEGKARKSSAATTTEAGR